ncbi:aldo/keto reductase [Sinobaca sp. H24]|uniref:aldo/keto reductase n=1 Tax=Sinobaca sp. H24 TaxID=2923376 RepID=UPI00207978BA|nr:aldo/keto reductase [Sinobaca sp. H24]
MKHDIKGKIGLGTAPLGNMYRKISEEEATSTIESAWSQGIRYYDTAPFYGAGLSESRLGDALTAHKRDEYVLSTKVGRVISDETEEKSGLFELGNPNKIITDFSEDATLRSIEQSLERLKTDRLDFVYVHDLSPDFLGEDWKEHFETAKTGAFKVLTQLRKEGVISSWGLGVNTTEPIEMALELEDTLPDLCLQATQYTLLNHNDALERMMPSAEEKDVGIVVGAPYNSGALVGGSHYNYQQITPDIKKKVEQMQEIADHHKIELKSAALQFSLAHPVTKAVIPGSSRPDRMAEDIKATKEEIPASFWSDLKDRGLISEKAPLPAGK